MDRSTAEQNIDVGLENNLVRKNLRWGRKAAKARGINLSSRHHAVIVDVSAGRKFRHLTIDHSPCITRARAMTQGFVVHKRYVRRRLTMVELAKLQGARLQRYNVNGILQSKMLSLIGNAMSRNCIDRVVPRLLQSAGLLSRMPEDKWATRHMLDCL